MAVEATKKKQCSCITNSCDCEDYSVMANTNPVYNVEYLNELKNRMLFINDDIDDWVMDEIGKRIIKWNQDDLSLDVEERKPISIYINTNGGCVYNCLGLVSIMIASKTPIHTVVLGKAFSAGSVIFLAGHKRSMYRYATYLIHEGYTRTGGAMSKTKEEVEFFDKYTKNQMKEIITSRSNISMKLMDKMYKTEWYMTAQQCLDLGITHEVL